jgi:hypothetical protein
VTLKDIFKTPEHKEPEGDKNKPTPEEQVLIDRFAVWVVKRGLTVPAIMALESTKPLNWIGSQMMLVAEPAAWAIEPMLKSFFKFNHQDYLKFQQLLEKRWSMEEIILAIERFDAEAKEKEDELRAQRKAERKIQRAKRNAKIKKFLRRFFGSERPEDLK